MSNKKTLEDGVNYIKIHGLQRSGTNYLTYLLNENFENTETLVNLGGWKHGPYSLQYILGEKEFPVLMLAKNPYAWLISVYNYWKNDEIGKTLGPDVSNLSFEQFVKSRAIFEAQTTVPYLMRAANPIQFWNNMNFHWASIRLKTKRVCILTYEALLHNKETVLQRISEMIEIPLKGGKLKDVKKELRPSGETVKTSEDTWKKRNYYINKEYLTQYTPDLLKFINANLDPDLMKMLHYEVETQNELTKAIDKGNKLLGEKKFTEAVKVLEKTIEEFPDSWMPYFNLGTVKGNLNKYEEALELFKKADTVGCPEKASIAHNMAYSYKHLNQFEKAMEVYEKALEIDPTLLSSRNNLGICKLTLGQWEEGFKDWEHRMVLNPIYQDIRNRFKDIPDWNGEECAGKRVLVYNEQGRGDSINFMRFLKKIQERGAYVIFEARKSLMKLLKNSEGFDEMLERTNPPKPVKADFVVSLNSLMRIFGTNIDNVPNKSPYIFPTPSKKIPEDFWKKYEGKFKVGISWAGSWTHPNDSTRSCENTHFKKLLSVPNVQLFSLQKIDPKQRRLVKAKNFYVDMKSYLKDFNELANIIQKMDLVIGVDTAMIHVAGAINKPVWNLVTHVKNDFRWLLDREDTVWYPSMRIFRQKKVDNWDELLTRVAKELKKVAKC